LFAFELKPELLEGRIITATAESLGDESGDKFQFIGHSMENDLVTGLE
jgi:hypothetical protein